MRVDFLSRILDSKMQEVEAARAIISESSLEADAVRRKDRRSFLGALAAPGPFGANIIAEIKRGSPSKGTIRGDLDPRAYAMSYEKGGAAALSVLTDRTYFQGGPEDLRQAKEATQLPVLRKDFILSQYQIYEAAAWGADAVLLIVRALSREHLKECLELCHTLQLDALVEVHSESELEDATWAGARLIGINNRDLTTFKTDIETSVRVARELLPEQIAVAESGIKGRADIVRLMGAGIWNFLIGESLVTASDPASFLGNLLGREKQ